MTYLVRGLALAFIAIVLGLVVFDWRIAIDLQTRPCIGRLFIYKKQELGSSILSCRGELKVIALKTEVAPYKKGTILIKRCIATYGEEVYVTKDLVRACSALGDCQTYKREFSEAIRLPKNYAKKWQLRARDLFILGDSSDSLDSRLIGPLHLEDISVYGPAYAIF